MKPLSLRWMRLKHSAWYAVAGDSARNPGTKYLITRLAYHGPVKWWVQEMRPADDEWRDFDSFVTLAEAKAAASDDAYWMVRS